MEELYIFRINKQIRAHCRPGARTWQIGNANDIPRRSRYMSDEIQDEDTEY